MFTMSIILLMFVLNLIKMVSEDSGVFYKDIRFWVILVSFLFLVTITTTTY